MKHYTGVDVKAIYAGVMMLTRKFSQALALFIVGLALEAFGFTKGAESQDAAALNGIWWVFLIGPGLLTLLAMYGAFRFRLSQECHKTLTFELERLRSGGKPRKMLNAGTTNRRVTYRTSAYEYPLAAYS